MLNCAAACVQLSCHRSYRALYRVLCTQMGKVKQSCDEYMQFVAIVNIKVNSLQVNEEKPALSYIEEWFAEQQVRHVVTLEPSDQGFKAPPGLKYALQL